MILDSTKEYQNGEKLMNTHALVGKVCEDPCGKAVRQIRKYSR
jgi:hypothetical protein